MPLREVTEEWLRDCERRWKVGDRMGGGTLKSYRMYVETRTNPGLGKTTLAKLDKHAIQAWADGLSLHHKPRTVKYIVATLNT